MTLAFAAARRGQFVFTKQDFSELKEMPNFTWQDEASVEAYITKMRSATMWGSGLEILMCHYLYGRPCVVFMEGTEAAPLATMNARSSSALPMGFIAKGASGEHWDSAVATPAAEEVACDDGLPVGLPNWMSHFQNPT